MTIEERIEDALVIDRHDEYGDLHSDPRLEFTKEELHELLEQVAKEQRVICVQEWATLEIHVKKSHKQFLTHLHL